MSDDHDGQMPEGYFLDRDEEARVIGGGGWHGPVDLHIDHSGSTWVLEFTGSEDGDILHSAADWMNSRRYACILALSWLGDRAPEDAPHPRSAMRMVVDMSYYRKRV